MKTRDKRKSVRPERSGQISMQRLTSDQLGKKGEDEFALLCSNAGLISNRVQQDRTGWDFLVELPFPISEPQEIWDRRPQPPECRVQVKTVWEHTNIVRVRLSSAERLAKHVLPACIVILVVAPDLRVVNVFAIHVLDEVLSRILELIRRCQAADSTRINKTFIGFRYKSLGVDLSDFKHGLDGFIKQIAGERPEEYVKVKSEQIENLGVLGNRFSGSFRLDIQEDEDIQDVMLGVKPGKAVLFSADETRWGITLPIARQSHERDGPMEVVISPHPKKGRVKLKNVSIDTALQLDADIILPATGNLLSTDSLKFLVVCDGFKITCRGRKKFSHIDFEYDASGTLSVQTLTNLAVANLIFSTPGAQMDLWIKKKLVMTSSLEEGITKVSKDVWTSSCKVLGMLSCLIEKSGGRNSDFLITLDDITYQWKAIQTIYLMIESPREMALKEFSFSANCESLAEDQSFEMLLVGRLRFIESDLVFAAIGLSSLVKTEEGNVKLSLRHLEVRQTEIIDKSEADYSDFVDRMRIETGLSWSMIFSDVRSRSSPED